MDIRQKAIQRVIEREGSEFLDAPIVRASGVANEAVEDEEASIRAERKPKPKQKKRGKRSVRVRPQR
jgi:hypothetical protein